MFFIVKESLLILIGFILLRVQKTQVKIVSISKSQTATYIYYNQFAYQITPFYFNVKVFRVKCKKEGEMNKDEKGIEMSKRTQAIWCSFISLILVYILPNIKVVSRNLSTISNDLNLKQMALAAFGNYFALFMFVAYLIVFAIMIKMILSKRIDDHSMLPIITIGFLLTVITFVSSCYKSVGMHEEYGLSILVIGPIKAILPVLFFGLALYHKHTTDEVDLRAFDRFLNKLKMLAILYLIGFGILIYIRSLNQPGYFLVGYEWRLIIGSFMSVILTYVKVMLLQYGIMKMSSLSLPTKLAYVLLIGLPVLYVFRDHIEGATSVIKVLTVLLAALITLLAFSEESFPKFIALGNGISVALVIMCTVYPSEFLLNLRVYSLLWTPFYLMIIINIAHVFDNDIINDDLDIVNY